MAQSSQMSGCLVTPNQLGLMQALGCRLASSFSIVSIEADETFTCWMICEIVAHLMYINTKRQM